jgi:hypothetical protein
MPNVEKVAFSKELHDTIHEEPVRVQRRDCGTVGER